MTVSQRERERERESNSRGAGVSNCDLITPRHCEGFSPKQSISRRLGSYGLPRFARSDAQRSSREAVAHKKAGFTLIEISMVLVIIGLIIGGVLVGRDLIKAAEVRSLVRQMDDIQVAVTTFKLKYNCIPGDCLNASAFGLGPNGNGDGVVGSLGYPGGCLNAGSNCMTKLAGTSGNALYINRAFGEIQYFWVHLSAAGLIKGNYTALALDDSAVASTQMGLYFPKDALGKGFLIAFSWNYKLYST